MHALVPNPVPKMGAQIQLWLLTAKVKREIQLHGLQGLKMNRLK